MNKHRTRASLILMGILLMTALVLFYTKANAQIGLINASESEVEQVALAYTKEYFEPQGEITILLVRSVTKEDLPLLGLPGIDFGGQDPPLMLVAIKGDFDVHRLSHSASEARPAQYIVYVFDLIANLPTLISTSPDGAHFRHLLNDPTLPDYLDNDHTKQHESGAPTLVPLAPAIKQPYGVTVPTVSPPEEIQPMEK